MLEGRAILGSTREQLALADGRHQDELECLKAEYHEQVKENQALYEEIKNLTEKVCLYVCLVCE